MTIIGRSFFKPPSMSKRFIGDWNYRLEGVFECGVDYGGKTILDAGCNIGIVDYEISKRGPAFIHGIDNYREGIRAARQIFQGVYIESRFDVVDLTNDRKLRSLLRPSYDIVIMMAVWQHIRKAHGDAVAERAVATLAEHCSGTFVAKTRTEMAHAFTSLMRRRGFCVSFDGDPLGRLFTFVRT